MKRVLLLMATFVGLTACNLDVPAPNGGNIDPSDPTKETFAPELKIDIATMTKTEAGTFYKDATIGTGPQLTGNAIIVWSWLGLLKNGTAFGTGANETVTLSTLVGGLQDAMRGMKVGGERVIVIPSILGFGTAQVGIVPPNSTLVYDVKLLGIP